MLCESKMMAIVDTSLLGTGEKDKVAHESWSRLLSTLNHAREMAMTVAECNTDGCMGRHGEHVLRHVNAAIDEMVRHDNFCKKKLVEERIVVPEGLPTTHPEDLLLCAVTIENMLTYWIAAPPGTCAADIQQYIEIEEGFRFEDEQIAPLTIADLMPVSRDVALRTLCHVESVEGGETYGVSMWQEFVSKSGAGLVALTDYVEDYEGE